MGIFCRGNCFRAGWLGGWLLLSCSGLSLAPVMAEEVDGEEETPIVLGEAEEKALQAVIEKLTSVKRGYYGEDILTTVDALTEELGLKPEQAEQLKGLAQPIIDATMEGWEEKAYEWLSPYVDKSNNAIRDMARWPIDQIARSPGVKGVIAPNEQPLWTEELKRVLTEEQWQTWQRLREQEAKQEQQNLKDFVEFAAEAMRPAMEEEMDHEINDLRHLLNLDGTRVDKLKDASTRAVAQAGGVWGEKAMAALQEMDRERRQSLVERGNGLAVEETVRAQDQEAWMEALEEQFSEVERELLQTARTARQDRRREALTGALVLVLEKAMALTQEQRVALPPVLQPAAAQMHGAMDRYYNIDANFVATALAEVDDEKFEPILVPLQMEALARLKSPENPYQRDEEAIEKARAAEPIETEEEMQRLLAEELYQRSEAERKAQLQRLATAIDDLRRTAKVPDVRLARLELAAMGAVQDAMESWREQLDRWLRNSFNGVQPSQLRERLASLGQARFGDEPDPAETELWKDVLKQEMRPPEEKRWQAEITRRQENRRRVQRQLVITELEQTLGLNETQVQDFVKPLDDLLLEYAVDMDEFMSRPWFLQSYSLLMPVAGLDDKWLAATLTESQAERWRSEGLSQVQHYWDSVKRKHDSRTGKEEAK